MGEVAFELEELFYLTFLASLLFLIFFVLDLTGSELSKASNSLLLFIFDQAFFDLHFRIVPVKDILFVVGVQVEYSVDVL